MTCQRGDVGCRLSPRMTSWRVDAGWRLSPRSTCRRGGARIQSPASQTLTRISDRMFEQIVEVPAPRVIVVPVPQHFGRYR